MSNPVTLATGEVVDSTDPEWAAECLIRHRHVLSMRSLDLEGRRRYLADVTRKEGAESGRRLGQAFTEDWTARKTGKAEA